MNIVVHKLTFLYTCSEAMLLWPQNNEFSFILSFILWTAIYKPDDGTHRLSFILFSIDYISFRNYI